VGSGLIAPEAPGAMPKPFVNFKISSGEPTSSIARRTEAPSPAIDPPELDHQPNCVWPETVIFRIKIHGCHCQQLTAPHARQKSGGSSIEVNALSCTQVVPSECRVFSITDELFNGYSAKSPG
jgi:hypothetical protein